MPIKYAESVKLDKPKEGKHGKNYAGASWLGENGFAPGSPLTGRAALRRAGQVKGKDNPLLGACRSRTQPTGRILPALASTRSSNQHVRAFMKWLERKQAEQNGKSEAQA